MITLLFIVLAPHIVFSAITYILIRIGSKWDDDPLSRGHTVLIALCPVINLFMFGYALWIILIKSLE